MGRESVWSSMASPQNVPIEESHIQRDLDRRRPGQSSVTRLRLSAKLFSPPASIPVTQQTIDMDGGERTIEVQGRHDPCIVPRIVPVVEAMVAITLLDCLLVFRAYRGWSER
jgi:chorismate synthase